MKESEQLEVDVFEAIQEKGESTIQELYTYITENLGKEISMNDLFRYVRRWKAKKIVALNFVNGETVYKLADIPPWYASGIMAICKGTTQSNIKDALTALDEKLKHQQKIIEPRSVYGDYHTYEATFETVDLILGGRMVNEEEELKFPTQNGKAIIPMNWFRGLTRDNAPLMNLPSSIAYHIGFSNGEFLEEPEMETVTLKVKIGTAKYEAIKAGTKFKIKMQVPMRGTKLNTKEQIQQFFNKISEIPLRGLGANPFAFGGRIKLVELKDLN